METTARAPLAAKNSTIPRPSKLPMPAVPAVSRKRPLTEVVESTGQENAVKRPKIALPSVAKSNKPAAAKATAKPTGKQTATKKPATTSAAMAKKGVPPARPVSTTANTGSKAKAGKVESKPVGGTKQKRPVWDLKGRLQDMEALMSNEKQSSVSTIGELQGQLAALADRLGGLEGLKEHQDGTIRCKQQENEASSQLIKDLQSDLSQAKLDLSAATTRYQHESEVLLLSKVATETTNQRLEVDLKAARAEIASLRSTVAQMAADSAAVQCQLDATKAVRDKAMSESVTRGEEIASLQRDLQSHLATIADCQARNREDETHRRMLHNTIQELKGNIRVFCRVRPFLPSELSPRQQPQRLSIAYPDGQRDGRSISLDYTAESSSSSSSASSSPRQYQFEFDRVFGPSSLQGAVFGEISQLVQSALDGYNVCIFAYGQTGSGKTFTMEGPPPSSSSSSTADDDLCTLAAQTRGMIPRAVEQIFDSAISLAEQGWQYEMRASFVEIYNETLRDLLSNGTDQLKHEIKMDPSNAGEVYLTNLTPTTVTSRDQVLELLVRAGKNRAVATTLCNERSSRSHSVFQLRLKGTNNKTSESCHGTLNMIDLAGSERVSQSGSTGERLKEAQNINKSLSTLGNVIMSLANKESHVPYRNSKLTYLLQSSLGGNSKTLMFVNMSPQYPAFQESLCSLRFATKVNQCNIGTARKK